LASIRIAGIEFLSQIWVLNRYFGASTQQDAHAVAVRIENQQEATCNLRQEELDVLHLLRQMTEGAR
jgi:hypothetical protein